MSHFRTVDDCRQHNERYPQFRHSLFVAGDVDQFQSHRDPTNGSNRPVTEIDRSANRWQAADSEGVPIAENVGHRFYKLISVNEVTTTFRYLFDKFKKGIFIKIRDNRLVVFLPFSKIKFTNEWGHLISAPPGKSMTDFLVELSKQQGYEVTKENLLSNPKQWYANNCLLRYESPLKENDRGYVNIKDMLETLCEKRQVPDIECFINKRDFPLLTNDSTEPYDHLYGSAFQRLLSHRYPKYCPILSMVTGDRYADIPIPTPEDWARAASQDRSSPKIFPGCRSYDYNFSVPWQDRIPTAVFRGSSTGCGVTLETNPRLKIAKMSQTSPKEAGIPLLDAGITSWNLRPRKTQHSPYLQTIDPARLGLTLVDPLSPEQQALYKYVVNLDGHVSAFRLSLELSMGCVVLLVKSPYRMWFSRYLREGVHYLSVKEDLSDLYDVIRWCRGHDKECKAIAENAKQFYETYLSEDGILDYWQTLLCNLKQTTGTYFYTSISPDSLVDRYQKQWLQEMQLQQVSDPLTTFHGFPFRGRSFHAMEALQRFIRVKGLDETIDPTSVLIYPQKSKQSSTTIHSHTIRGTTKKLIVKRAVNARGSNRFLEMQNEAMIGLGGINELCHRLPHFRYTYFYHEDQLVSEFVEGRTLKEYLLHRPFTAADVLRVMLMTTMALAVAQEKVGFVHYDLYPWNIILQEYATPQTIIYQFGSSIINVSTRLIPVIIDYGRSHVIYKSQHTGMISPFSVNPYQDIMTMVISIVSDSLQRKPAILPLALCLGLVNFFVGTDFLPSPLRTEEELVEFVTTNARYNEMVYGSRRYGMITKTPVAFISHLFSLDSSFHQSEWFKFQQIEGGVRAPLILREYHVTDFYYDIITGGNLGRSIMTYLTLIHKSVESWLSEKGDVQYYYASNMVMVCLDALVDFMSSTKTAMTEPISGLLTSIRGAVGQAVSNARVYPYLINSQRIGVGSLAPRYQASTFTLPSHILTLLENYETRSEDVIIYRDMVVWTTRYKMPIASTPQSKMLSFHRRILGLDALSIRAHNANVLTLRRISRDIYQQDLETIQHLPHEQRVVMQDIILFTS